MSLHATLPPASEIALAHSHAVQTLIRDEIHAAGGWIPFEQFMNLALYAPGMGYYSSGATKLGSAGDFVTASEISSLFGRTLAQQVLQISQQIKHADILEFGAGSGKLALDLLLELEKSDALPGKYFILEVSAELRQRQQMLFANKAPHLVPIIEWLEQLPAQFTGTILANEVLDALPTPRFVVREGEVYEEMVVLDANENFIRVDQPADALLRAAVRHIERDTETPLPENYRSEVLPQLPYWIQAVGGLIEKGVMLFVDYGYPRREYYLPERSDGTLVCHYRHHAHNDPFYLPGLQDITAFVDFTAVAEAGVNAGFDLSGYCAQAGFLIGNGLAQITETLEHDSDEVALYHLHQEIKKLTLPGEMGERFQVIGFQRDVEFRDAFAVANLSRRL